MRERESTKSLERAKKIVSMSYDEQVAFMRAERPHDYGPWILKERPAGDWVVDQLDRTTMKVRRFGPYKTTEEAREVWMELKAHNVELSNSPSK